MAPNRAHEITQLLARACAGEARATNELFPLVYDELRLLASRFLVSERPSHTLQATALVNEAYLRLVGAADIPWENRAHFFGAAAKAIRRILTDHARSRARLKRGGALQSHPLAGLAMPELSRDADVDLVALDEALTELAALDATKARVIELRFFAGLSVEDTARVLNVSERSIVRAWEFARVWLHARLAERGIQ